MKDKDSYIEKKKRDDFVNGLALALVEHYGHFLAARMSNRLARRIDYMARNHRRNQAVEARNRIVYSNCYARSLIAAQTGLRLPEIPKELGAAKQIQLTIKRFIKELKNENHSRSKKRTRKCLSRA